MDYDGRFIMQKTVDRSLLRSTSDRLLPTGRKNDGMTIPVSACALLNAHIDYFTRSQNNDSTNIIIISLNYHRIIHKNNPHFNRKKFHFEFQNGEVLRLKLYEHLKVLTNNCNDQNNHLTYKTA